MLEYKTNQKEKFVMSYNQLIKCLPKKYTNNQTEKVIYRLF